jgi:hypothetical protein
MHKALMALGTFLAFDANRKLQFRAEMATFCTRTFQ